MNLFLVLVFICKQLHVEMDVCNQNLTHYILACKHVLNLAFNDMKATLNLFLYINFSFNANKIWAFQKTYCLKSSPWFSENLSPSGISMILKMTPFEVWALTKVDMFVLVELTFMEFPLQSQLTSHFLWINLPCFLGRKHNPAADSS